MSQIFLITFFHGIFLAYTCKKNIVPQLKCSENALKKTDEGGKMGNVDKSRLV